MPKVESSVAYERQPAPVPAADVDATARRLAYLTVGLPTIGFVAGLVYSSYFGFSAVDMWLLAVMYLLTALGVETGLHRFFSHRAFKAGPGITALLGILGSMAAQGPILFWAATHRLHHAFTDQDGDPHSPRPASTGKFRKLKGLWHGHVGWLFTIKRGNWAAYVPDLLADRWIVAISQRYPLWVLLGLAIPAGIGGVFGGWQGALGGFLWGGLARIFLLDHVTWAVNSLGHTIGRRPNATRDNSRNIALLALFSMGGAWHNNHHANPAVANNDWHYWQIDISAWFIRLLEALGFVNDVRYRRDTSGLLSGNFRGSEGESK